jgi:hypothetical protein
LNLRPLECIRGMPTATERCGKQRNRLYSCGIRRLERLRLYPITSGSGWLNPEGKQRAIESRAIPKSSPSGCEGVRICLRVQAVNATPRRVLGMVS